MDSPSHFHTHSTGEIAARSWSSIPLSQTFTHSLALSSKPGHLRYYTTSATRQIPPRDRGRLPHLTQSSEVHVISVTAKQITHRVALAIGHVKFSKPETLKSIRQNALKKGDVLAISRVAGIQAVKKTSELIPLAHSGVPVEGVVVKVQPVGGSAPTFTEDSVNAEEVATGKSKSEDINAAIDQLAALDRPISEYGGIRIAAQVETTAKTGVEMEALAGVMGAALTIMDMVKSVDRGVSVEEVRVIGKKGGRSGGWGVWADG